MTYRAIVQISCDSLGCRRVWERETDRNEENLKSYSAYLAVKRDGWRVVGFPSTPDPSRAYCPDHALVNR